MCCVPRSVFTAALFVASLAVSVLPAHALEKQPASVYHARRMALAAKLKGGAAVIFAADEPQMEYLDFRQDEDFYYLTGWNEPGAALLVVADAPVAQTPRGYKEILFLPTRDLRLEKYTGPKLDAASPGVIKATGVDAVESMTALPTVLNRLIEEDRKNDGGAGPRLAKNLWMQPGAEPSKALLSFLGATLGMESNALSAQDVTGPMEQLRAVKDEGEVALLKKASAVSIAAQRVMMKAVKPGVTERSLAGKMTAAWLEGGCERASYPPIVGSGINSTILHYAENARTLADGDVLLVDAACEYSMYASDITRTVPVSGHFTARQREIYDIVLGAQQAAIDAFVAGKSKINDRERKDPDSLDNAAYNYINTHGKDLHGEPLGKYWLHGLGHMVGIDVHDPSDYPAVLKPGMVFTIEPGVYIPEEKLGVRIECVFLVGGDGKLIDLTADLPHSAQDVEAAMRAK
jgi:Xaa-Pro aminopeptidase